MRIANLRTHVEHAIKRVKVWHVFDQVLPLSMAGVVKAGRTQMRRATKFVIYFLEINLSSSLAKFPFFSSFQVFWKGMKR